MSLSAMGKPRTENAQRWHERMHRHGKHALGGLMVLVILFAVVVISR